MHEWTDAEIRDRLYGNYYEEESNVHESSGYRAMVDDIKERIGYAEGDVADGYDPFEDVANHGADTGWPGFTYTSECVEFYERHEDAIYDMLREDADDMGYSNPDEMIAGFNRSDMLDTPDGRKNLLAWYALETVARRLTDQ